MAVTIVLIIPPVGVRPGVLVILLILAGCTAPISVIPYQTSRRSLTMIEMDQITVGDARADSQAAAQAFGVAATATALSSDVSLTEASSAATLISSYASSQNAATAMHATSAHAVGNAEISVGTAGKTSAGAEVGSVAQASGQAASAQIGIQLYGLVAANDTSLVFGKVTALACCAPQAGVQAAVEAVAVGPYVAEVEAEHTAAKLPTRAATIDFAVVSSLLPITDLIQLSGMAALK